MPRFTKKDLEYAVAQSNTIAEVIRLLDTSSSSGTYKTIHKYLALWDISTDHFDADLTRKKKLQALGRKKRTPLEEILVTNNNYNRTNLKERLYKEGYKKRKCEMCGQGEKWRGKKMGLILDHINGINNDNRIENLRIVCPNCNATLDTHCGKHKYPKNYCECGKEIGKKSIRCITCANKFNNENQPTKIDWPPTEELVKMVKETNYSYVGRKLGVSDNAVRKRIKNHIGE